MTELLPLFSYLERLNVYKESFVSTKDRDTMAGMLKVMKNQSEKDDEVITVERMSAKAITRGGDSVGECSVCLDNLSDLMLPCLHAFCT